MNVSLHQAAAALSSNSRMQEIVAENLAASMAPGFKKLNVTVEAIDSGLLPASALQSSQGNTTFVMPKAVTTTDFTQGEMRYTGLNTDLGIEGRAFFEVQLPNGQTGYTRNGQFHLDSQNRLVTSQGFLVMGDGGPIQLEMGAEGSSLDSLSVNPDGTIAQGGLTRGKFRLVEFANPQLLKRASGGIYLQPPSAPLAQNPDPISTVRQRWVEGSNASPTIEMATLMTTMRSFEANQRIIQIQDERMGKVISELSPA